MLADLMNSGAFYINGTENTFFELYFWVIHYKQCSCKHNINIDLVASI